MVFLRKTHFYVVFHVSLFAGKNDSFGENFGLTAERVTGKAKASVRALTYCDLHSISRNNLLYIMRAYPEFRTLFNTDMQITYDLRDLEVNNLLKYFLQDYDFEIIILLTSTTICLSRYE